MEKTIKKAQCYLDRDKFLLKAISTCIELCREIDTKYKDDKVCYQFVEDILKAIKHTHTSINKSIDDIQLKINNIMFSKCLSLEEYLKMTLNHNQEGTGD